MNKEDVTSATVSDDDYSYYGNDEAQSRKMEAAPADPPAYESAPISKRLEQGLCQANGKSISINVETQADRNALELYAAACLGDLATTQRLIELGADIGYGNDAAIRGALANNQFAFAEAYCDGSKLFNLLYKLKSSTRRNNYLKEMILTRRFVLTTKEKKSHKVFNRIGVATFSEEEFDTLYEIYGNYIFYGSGNYTYLNRLNHARMLCLLDDDRHQANDLVETLFARDRPRPSYRTCAAKWRLKYEQDVEMRALIALHPRVTTYYLGTRFEEIIYHSAELATRLAQADKDAVDNNKLPKHHRYYFDHHSVLEIATRGYDEALALVLDRLYISKAYPDYPPRVVYGIDGGISITTDYSSLDKVLSDNHEYRHRFVNLLQNRTLYVYLFKKWENMVKSFNPQEAIAILAQNNYLDGIKKCLKWWKKLLTVDDLTYSLDLSTDKKCRKKLQKALNKCKKKLAKENKKRRK